MAGVRILELATTRVVVPEFQVPDLNPDDELTALLVLAREIRARRLGDPARYRIQIWHQRRHWVEHRPKPK